MRVFFLFCLLSRAMNQLRRQPNHDGEVHEAGRRERALRQGVNASRAVLRIKKTLLSNEGCFFFLFCLLSRAMNQLRRQPNHDGQVHEADQGERALRQGVTASRAALRTNKTLLWTEECFFCLMAIRRTNIKKPDSRERALRLAGQRTSLELNQKLPRVSQHCHTTGESLSLQR